MSGLPLLFTPLFTLTHIKVVAQDNIEMVGPHTFERNVNAFDHSFGTEVEVSRRVTPQLGAQKVAVTWN